MRSFIGKRTEKLRYIIVPFIIKHVTPSLYGKIETIIKDTWSILPRPSIKVMKGLFCKRLVRGCEIGVNRGVHAKSILKELNIEKLYLVDVWVNYEGSDSNRLKIDDNYRFVMNEFEGDKRIEIIKDFSVNAINKIENNSLDFVYIDANHLYEYVYQDIRLWSEKVKKGGVVAGHDIFNHIGVTKAVKKFCFENDVMLYVRIPDWYFIKENNEGNFDGLFRWM